ncbi:hypothetical protein [Rhodococcus tukisamuensis]|uniref:Uncharacterized protein n=1 Tax=Rhodococcus tukisamuensis TaxID=168276 RepID=A0A1G7DH62_9NOCA|nr:hypothetical protein [Rhodococcus tukisamuensis]SDE50155.1 hypothetical protein SAMN05444580_11921 [Rhodococcus tukisamuensis]
MITEKKFVDRIIAEYGPLLDLRERPQVIAEILRKYHGMVASPDGGSPPGGVGPPTSVQLDEPTNAELMRKLLEISRSLAKLRKALDERPSDPH